MGGLLDQWELFDQGRVERMKIELSSNMKKPHDSRWKNVQKENHRRKGRSYTRWFANGQKASEDYYVNGEIHNPKGPAYTSWWDNGQKWYEDYYINGEHHNAEGPATTKWDSNGQKCWGDYYINGGPLTKGQWENRCKLN